MNGNHTVGKERQEVHVQVKTQSILRMATLCDRHIAYGGIGRIFFSYSLRGLKRFFSLRGVDGGGNSRAVVLRLQGLHEGIID